MNVLHRHDFVVSTLEQTDEKGRSLKRRDINNNKNNLIEISRTSWTTNDNEDNDDDDFYHMIIHFDINETILIGDEAGGDTKEQCINKILAKSAYVQIPSSHNHNNIENSKNNYDDHILLSQHTVSCQPTHWWNGLPITSQQELEKVSEHNNIPPPLYTGWIWPKNCCPYYRTSYKNYGPSFILHHGKIYQPIYDLIYQEIIRKNQMMMTMTMPSANQSTITTTSEYPSILPCLLPSFFETLMILFPSENHTTTHPGKKKRKVSIVLRTFGSDLYGVAQCITIFAKGQHPHYRHYYNSQLIMSSSEDESDVATTTTNNNNILLLCKGRWKRKELEVPTRKQQFTKGNHDSTPNDEDEYIYTLLDDHDRVVAENDAMVLEWIHAHAICGIQDDYAFWKKNHYQPWSGKPIWMVKPTTTLAQNEQLNKKPLQQHYHHVLFDDNIHRLLDYSIATIRKQVPDNGNNNNDSSFRTLSNQDILRQHGLHLFRVPTIEPIFNPQWFVERIDEAHERYRSEYGF